ncbi:hypothetical protein Tco_0002141 [Tanacetum coccineum]
MQFQDVPEQSPLLIIWFEPESNEALKYAKIVNMEENQQRETERRSKQRHARIMLERQVNKEVDEGYQHLKVKLKDMEQPSPEAQLLLNLKRQIKNDRDSDHEIVTVNSEQGEKDNETAKFIELKAHNDNQAPENTNKTPIARVLSVTTTLSAKDYYTRATTMTVTPVLETIQETQENPIENVTETPPATPPTRTKKKRAKTLLKKAIKKINWKKAATKCADQSQERAKELRVQSWFNELVDAEEEPKENELINGLVVLFGKCMKKFIKNDKITCNIPKLGRSGIWVGDGSDLTKEDKESQLYDEFEHFRQIIGKLFRIHLTQSSEQHVCLRRESFGSRSREDTMRNNQEDHFQKKRTMQEEKVPKRLKIQTNFQGQDATNAAQRGGAILDERTESLLLAGNRFTNVDEIMG